MALQRLARNQAASVMQGLRNPLALGSVIGTYSRPGPHVFSYVVEGESRPISWVFWPPDDDEKFDAKFG